MNKAVFLDKDGTLINDIPYNVNPKLITLAGNAITGLKRLQLQGYKLIIVSNQSGVARGLFNEAALIGVREKIEALLNKDDIHLDGFYYCPHHPDGIITGYSFDCDCRKPKPGMLLRAATELDIDLEVSWMIGDILNDVEAGNRSGAGSILIDNGNETEWIKGEFREPAYKATNINDAADFILNSPS